MNSSARPTHLILNDVWYVGLLLAGYVGIQDHGQSADERLTNGSRPSLCDHDVARKHELWHVVNKALHMHLHPSWVLPAQGREHVFVMRYAWTAHMACCESLSIACDPADQKSHQRGNPILLIRPQPFHKEASHCTPTFASAVLRVCDFFRRQRQAGIPHPKPERGWLVVGGEWRDNGLQS